MTTPYGTTTFAYTAPGTAAPPRFVHATDPMGFSEREEWLEPAPVASSDPPASVPTGMSPTLNNSNLQFRNSFHWDKNAYLAASCTPTGGCDYSKARLSHFTHIAAGGAVKGTALESTRQPLENRAWYTYPGQVVSINAGTYNQPSAVGRVLDDGSTQLWRYAYDTTGLFKLTQVTDPLGRITQFTYANGIDLLAITQATTPAYNPGGSMWTTIAQYTYDYRHRPLTYVDAAGQTTVTAYNAKGQLTTLTNPLGETTEYQYDTAHNLATVINANSATDATYTYDSFARVRTYTDSEGWTVTYDYDAADRVTKVTYPDGSFESYVYDRLDLVAYTDRQYRTWTYVYDANRRLTSVTDPQNQQTQYGYDRDGRLTSLTDPRTNVTGWTYDVQGRLTGKQYPNTSTVTYAYETTTSRLKSVTDAASQVKTYSYAKDDRLTAIVYTGAVNSQAQCRLHLGPVLPAPGLAHRRCRHHAVHLRSRRLAGRPAGAAGARPVRQQRHHLGL